MIRGGMAFHGTQDCGSHLPANRRDGLMLLYKPGRAFTDGPESGHRAQSFSLLIKPIRGGTFGVHHGMRRHTLMGREGIPAVGGQSFSYRLST